MPVSADKSSFRVKI